MKTSDHFKEPFLSLNRVFPERLTKRRHISLKDLGTGLWQTQYILYTPVSVLSSTDEASVPHPADRLIKFAQVIKKDSSFIPFNLAMKLHLARHLSGGFFSDETDIKINPLIISPSKSLHQLEYDRR